MEKNINKEKNIKKGKESEEKKEKPYIYIGPKIKSLGLIHGTIRKGEQPLKIINQKMEKRKEEIKEEKKSKDENVKTKALNFENKCNSVDAMFVPADKDLSVKIKNCKTPGTRENMHYQNILELIKVGEL
ncbi:MAG: hypothetical protein ACRC0V_11595 [Fusobacteriaceae bacterium]